MARKSAPTRSPRAPARPTPPEVTKSPFPRSRADGLRSQALRGMNRSLLEEDETTRPPRRMKTGGMCRGMGAATRGGGYKS